MQRLLDQGLKNPSRSGLSEELDHAVLLALSRFLAGTNAKSPVAPNRLCRVLALCGREKVPQRGLPGIAPFPDLSPDGWPTAAPVLRKAGLSQADLVELYEESEHQLGIDAHLDPELVAAIIPAELWPVVAFLMLGGPELAVQCGERAIRTYARTEVPADRNRTAGLPAKATVKDMHSTLTRLFRTLVELRKRGAGEAFTAWLAVPAMRLPKVAPQRRDTAAPPLSKVRLALEELNATIATRLRIRVGEDELAAIAAMKPTHLHGCNAFRPLRDRAVLVLLAATGGRVSAVASLRKSDYVKDHVGVPPDHRHGSAILLRPGKTVAASVVRPKLIPEEMARMLDAYLLLLERGLPVSATYAMRHRPEHGAKRTTPPQDYPLLVSDRTNFRPFGAGGIRILLSGKLPDGRHRCRKPLVVREHGLNPELPAELRQYVGYPPHTYRHLAHQLGERAGQIWNERHPPSGGAPVPEPGLYVDALLDHQPGSTRDRMRMLYGDRDTEPAIELLAGRAIEITWQLLTSELGARRRPDLDAISEKQSELLALESQRERIAAEIDRVHSVPRRPLPAKKIVEEPNENASEREFLRHISRQNATIVELEHLMHERLDAAEARITKLAALAEASARTAEARELAGTRLTALVYNQNLWEILPDSAPPGAEHVEVDLEAILRGTPVRPAGLEAGPEPDAVRDWLTIAEFGETCGVGSRSTIARWLSGSSLPRHSEHRPWEPGAVPLDESLGAKFRRIWVPPIPDSFWPSDSSRRRLRHLLSRWPGRRGWGSESEPNWRCQAELVLPSSVRPGANVEEGS